MTEKVSNLIVLVEQYPVFALFAFIILFVIATIIRKSFKLIMTLVIVVVIVAAILHFREDWLTEKSIKNFDIDSIKEKSKDLKNEAKKKLLDNFSKDSELSEDL